MAYYIIYSYIYVDNIYVIAWIISGILILSLLLTVTHLHRWRRGWVSMMVSPHCWVLNRGCWQCFPPCSGQIWRSDSSDDFIMSIDIAGLACTVLSSTRRRPHYNRSPGCQPSELPLMVGAQQHHQPLVNRIKSIRPRADQDDVEIECKLVTHLFLPVHSHSLPIIDLGVNS